MFSFLPSLKTIERPSYENKGYDSVWCIKIKNARGDGFMCENDGDRCT
jgi:hypothetical protein